MDFGDDIENIQELLSQVSVLAGKLYKKARKKKNELQFTNYLFLLKPKIIEGQKLNWD